MKWYKPIDKIKTEIKEPVQRVAVVAFIALVIAVSALIIAIGKDT